MIDFNDEKARVYSVYKLYEDDGDYVELWDENLTYEEAKTAAKSAIESTPDKIFYVSGPFVVYTADKPPPKVKTQVIVS